MIWAGCSAGTYAAKHGEVSTTSKDSSKVRSRGSSSSDTGAGKTEESHMFRKREVVVAVPNELAVAEVRAAEGY